MTRSATVVFLLAVSAASVWAGGWHDYQLPISPWYTIYRMNSYDVGLGGPVDAHTLIVVPSEYKLGPITGYILQDNGKSVWLRLAGLKSPDSNDPVIDLSREYFFIVQSPGEIDGPMSIQQFLARPLVRSQKSLKWQEPHNPNFWLPLYGTVVFLLYSAVILRWPVALFGILLLALIVFLGRRRWKSRPAA